MKFLTWDELRGMPPQRWLIRDFIEEASFVTLYGPSGCGKSFVALDMALCIATGQSWHGQKVLPGAVIYLAAEGATGLPKRVAAWLQQHDGVTLDNARFLCASLFASEDSDADDADTNTDDVVESDADLRKRMKARVAEVINLFEAEFPEECVDTPEGYEFYRRSDESLRLIVIDTLARNFSGDDENSSRQMSMFLDALEPFRRKHHATVMLVHHSNAAGTRERGSGALRGAMESMIECSSTEKDNCIEHIDVKADKQKDDEKCCMRLTMERVEVTGIQRDPDDERTPTTLVAIAGELVAVKPKAVKPVEEALPTKKVNIDMLRLLAGHPDGLTHGEWMLKANVKKSTFNRRLAELKTAKLVVQDGLGRYSGAPAAADGEVVRTARVVEGGKVINLSATRPRPAWAAAGGESEDS